MGEAVKICKDCVHARYLSGHEWSDKQTYGIGAFDSGYYCARTEYSVSSGGELVTGNDRKRMTTCQRERERWFGCGPKGKFFEAKDPTP